MELYPLLNTLTHDPSTAAIYAAVAALAFTLALALIFASRAARLRKWGRVLAQPSSRLQKRRGKAQLPSGVDLDTETPLFDVLYERYRGQPSLVRESAEALEAADASDALVRAEHDSDDDRANRLVDLGHYHQNPAYLPSDTVASTWLRNLLPVVKGKKKLKTGVEHAVLDSLGPGGGLAGAKAAEALGLAAAPFLAGLGVYALPVLMVLGAWAGSAAGRKMGARMRARKVYVAARKVRVRAKLLKRAFFAGFPTLMRHLEGEHEAHAARARTQYRGRQNRLTRLLFPDLMTAFFRRCLERLARDRAEELALWKRLRRKLRALGPVEFAIALEQLSGGKFLDDPELLACDAEFRAAVRELQEAQCEADREVA